MWWRKPAEGSSSNVSHKYTAGSHHGETDSLIPKPDMTPSLASSSEKKNKHDTTFKDAQTTTITSFELDEDLKTNPFRDPKAAEYWQAVYKKSQYECREAFDPNLEWDAKEERKIVRKLDWHVCTWACVMFFALQVDRGNLKQAVSADMLEELNLSTNEYNYGEILRTRL